MKKTKTNTLAMMFKTNASKSWHFKLFSIRESGCFTIMAVECTDSYCQQRWVGNDLKDHEDFIGAYEVGSITF